MLNDKASADHSEHVENPEHEAMLNGALVLASLFSSCVEAFGLIQPSHKWEKEEQLLLTRLGLQQARLLIWGSVVGVPSPPATVTDRAVPKHPSLAYPDLKEPTFFDARDPRLDESGTRSVIEETLSAIVDRSSHTSREEMMAHYGLKPPKRFAPRDQAFDMTRLESFREKYELLREVAETRAQINTRRANSIIRQPWTIADTSKFRSFIKLTQEKVDFLIDLMGVKQRVDLGCRMDIRVFGWHIAPDRTRTSQDISKLRLLQEICKEDYPEYLEATQQALDNISREGRESNMAAVKQQQAALAPPASNNGGIAAHGHEKKKRPGFLKMFKSFGKTRGTQSRPVSPTADQMHGPERSRSDAGPVVPEDESLSRVRSKSVGDEADMAENLRLQLEKLVTSTSIRTSSDERPVVPAVSRHDQYHGISRVPTKNLHQGDY
ncbi:unnamed protein product [Zymoseptoria tritici ST99CH_1A5]|uniref:Prion-inhibition and propagation HeLo domain-containing protein n=3 Tax=Zymoseptoria tritici TaxID=1047171 RepID=F9XNV4_ZYMTI|nr:uncharacterized protein MYCGRDRAFT_77461 [Zymoseptoria tritici IPO323]EGP83102.1 hypothetical protein MYCGRDRAFT_77461 [Zymoseptoria tritici IPO323]SMR60978.1 unnamed protein product [Zymoseptoria tritici ST99CH_1E4]SMR64124.1 unnamed protein product [Zymoseptoria tritici ST99CH_3D1]SMY29470.1 unnamed protein product [Zymoseptoria tritici ST99CH_1A5]